MDRHLHAVLDFGEQSLTSGINLGIKYVYSRAFLPVPRASCHSDWAQADLRLVSAQSPRPLGLAVQARTAWSGSRAAAGGGHGPCTGGHGHLHGGPTVTREPSPLARGRSARAVPPSYWDGRSSLHSLPSCHLTGSRHGHLQVQLEVQVDSDQYHRQLEHCSNNL